ncbi:MAG TPA: oligosaccharide flippase family protein, partial [Chitinophagaceae bacterium]|nr:oligosaccharide flippase family protein [Chitinophagaceae bacterium]
TQSDKIILSNVLKLTDFGYYALAATVSSSLAILLFPVTSAVFPRMTELINKEDQVSFLKLFHGSSQLISLLIIPLGLSLFIFSNDIIIAWTRNTEIAGKAGPILKYLILGSTINSLMIIPYQYTLAVGWLRFGINISLVAILFFLPIIFFAAYRYGAIGGAFMWMILNMAYFIFAMLYLFSKHLRKENKQWYLVDIGRPLLVCLIFAIPFFLFHEYSGLKNIYALLLFGFCLVVCYSATLWWGTPGLKPEVIHFIRKIRGIKTMAL